MESCCEVAFRQIRFPHFLIFFSFLLCHDFALSLSLSLSLSLLYCYLHCTTGNDDAESYCTGWRTDQWRGKERERERERERAKERESESGTVRRCSHSTEKTANPELHIPPLSPSFIYFFCVLFRLSLSLSLSPRFGNIYYLFSLLSPLSHLFLLFPFSCPL